MNGNDRRGFVLNGKRKRKRSKAVSASELAQMGICERLVVFEHRYGKRSTACQRAAMRRGLKEHQHFCRDGVGVSEKKGRCYIAPLVFGPGPEQTNEPVAAYGYVAIQRPGASRPEFHRVHLLKPKQVIALVARRHAILSGSQEADYARSAGLCEKCPFRRRRKPPRDF